MSDKNSVPPSPTLILRVAGGGYLLYLSWDLILASDLLFQLIGGVFAVAGGLLVWTSLSSFLHNEYFYDDKSQKNESKKNESKKDGKNGTRESS